MAKPRKTNAQGRTPTSILLGLGALVVALAAIVIGSLPGDNAPASATADAGAEPAAQRPDAAARSSGAIERLAEASCELAILTDKTPEALRALDAEAVGKLLDTRHCGGACDLVKAAMSERSHFELDVTKAEDFILPPREAFEAMGPTLTSAERESINERPNLLVVRAHFPPSVDQLAARACFSATAAAATRLDGIVYDEVARRFETASQVAAHAVTAPRGQPPFLPRQIAIQLYRQDDGTARLVTHGMARFGSPDFVIRGATMDEGPALANVINVVAWHAAAMEGELPLLVTLADVARVTGLTADRLSKDPAASKPVRLDVVDNERREGDPDNEILELAPTGGATAEGWSDALASLYGEPRKIVSRADGPELEAAAKRARASLQGAIARWKAAEGDLFLKGPFPIPGREDAGAAGFEWMWIDVASCDAKQCTGALSNSPGYASNLAAGKTVKIDRERAGDWLLRLRDGGAAGGESIEILAR